RAIDCVPVLLPAVVSPGASSVAFEALWRRTRFARDTGGLADNSLGRHSMDGGECGVRLAHATDGAARAVPDFRTRCSNRRYAHRARHLRWKDPARLVHPAGAGGVVGVRGV